MEIILKTPNPYKGGLIGIAGQTFLLFLLSSLSISLILTGSLSAGIHKDVGTTGFSFLKLGVGARSVAMGGAATALADDPSAMYYNPAATIKLEDRQFLAGYHNYVLDIQSGFVAGTMPFWGDKSIGAFIDYMNYGDFTRTNSAGVVDPDDGEFSGGDFLLGINFSTPIPPFPALSAGINAKFMTEMADGYSSEAFAFDLGLYYEFRDSATTAGLAVTNLGWVLSGFSSGSEGEVKDDLPMALRLGVSHSLKELPLIAAIDGVYPNDNNPYINAGLEMYYFQPLYLRLGYSSFGENYKTESGGNALGGFSFGFGLDYREFQFSYGFVPYLDLGTSHRITVKWGIGNAASNSDNPGDMSDY